MHIQIEFSRTLLEIKTSYDEVFHMYTDSNTTTGTTKYDRGAIQNRHNQRLTENMPRQNFFGSIPLSQTTAILKVITTQN